MELRIADRIACTEVEGPFRRFALWVSGCTIRCPGCCNPSMFEPQGGAQIPTDQLAEEIACAQRRHALEGLTVVGGEPLDQMPALIELCQHLRDRVPTLGILVFTGYELEHVADRAALHALLPLVDTIVDGPFDALRKEPPGGRRFLGSTNQRLLHQTCRYADATLWRGPNGAELRVDERGNVRACGHPDAVRRALRAIRPARA